MSQLPKALYDKLIAAGVTAFELKFTGGNDEGSLNIEFTPVRPYSGKDPLYDEVETWAWNVYEYNGAGDGSDYGDNYLYNLADKTIKHTEWYTRAEENEPTTLKFSLS